ncbi:MAG: TIM barrel protein [Candidatus Lokiarchaeota archaeon]|nr:TIM barrel protein [Candidatus Lokiarchaeota archaeon]
MKISVATYSFRHLINEGWTFKQIADELKKWNISYVEINNVFTTPQKLPKDVQLFKENGIKTILLTIDGNNYFKKRKQAQKAQFEWMKPWIDAANEAGINIIRANMGHCGFHLGYKRPLRQFEETFRPILEYCEGLGIAHVFENHGGLSSNVDFQLLVKKRFPSENMGYLLDCGNYRPKSDVYKNIELLGGAIKIVHAKMYEFDENNMETRLDYEKIMHNLTKIGFSGFLSVEYEGSLSDLDGIDKSINLLRQTMP